MLNLKEDVTGKVRSKNTRRHSPQASIVVRDRRNNSLPKEREREIIHPRKQE